MHYHCPYCSHHATLNATDVFRYYQYINVNKSACGLIGIVIDAFTCPNKDCRQLKLKVLLKSATQYGDEGQIVRNEWQLLPQSEAKVMPDYVPQPIVEDYYEACKIKDLSPKASATLARRCLQGMIRDFHGISKNTLNEEIQALEDIVPSDVWTSIDAVRKVGNIGAHMKKDIDIIVNVEPEEAQLLLSLIEQLVDDWYVTRQDRKLRAEKIQALAVSKK